jgi:DNA-binding response OmpR family regulator
MMTDQKTILVVEDEEDQRVWLTTFLEDHGYATVTAVDGEKGFARAQAGNIDLITLDISMDNQSGIKMFRRLQESDATTDIPVIMITGVAAEFKKFIERAKQVSSPAGYFEKPFDETALLAKVRELIG